LTLAATASAVAICALALAPGAHAETPEEVAARVARLQKQVDDQAAQLATQQDEIVKLKSLSAQLLDATRGAGEPVATAGPEPIAIAQAGPTVSPTVGEPPPPSPKVEVASVPEGYLVLMPQGHLSLEPGVTYTHASSNRLVFRGIEIVTGVQIGVIEANDADANATEAVLNARYGLLRNLEIDARVPYISRDDRVTTLEQRDQQISRTLNLRGSDIGDVELAARYQLNSGRGDWPVFIAGLRVKSDTGTGPFDVKRDQFGIATELATGSGFWGVEGSLSFLYPSDPIVIYGGVSYLDQFIRHYNRTVGGVLVGKVDPGDSIGANLGFGFALNPRFSFSLGYKHNYLFGTKTVFDKLAAKSNSLQVGAFTFGWSFAINDRITFTNTYEIGTTRDSPDMRVLFTVPIRF
jgi:hypothetical protein